MNIVTRHFEGIKGLYVEFQISNHPIKSSQAEHWKVDSLFLSVKDEIHSDIFGNYLGDGWWYGFNQIDHDNAIKLANDLMAIPNIKELADWIFQNSTQGTYLNILGV